MLGVTVWILIVNLGTGTAGPFFQVDNIASKSECEILATEIHSAYHTASKVKECFAVNKVSG